MKKLQVGRRNRYKNVIVIAFEEYHNNTKNTVIIIFMSLFDMKASLRWIERFVKKLKRNF